MEGCDATLAEGCNTLLAEGCDTLLVKGCDVILAEGCDTLLAEGCNEPNERDYYFIGFDNAALGRSVIRSHLQLTCALLLDTFVVVGLCSNVMGTCAGRAFVFH